MNRAPNLLVSFVLLLVPRFAHSQITVPANTSDIGSQINAAQAALPQNGGKIVITDQASGQCYSFAVPIVITKAIVIEGQGPSTCLSFTGTGAAISFSNNAVSFVTNDSPADGFGLRDLT